VKLFEGSWIDRTLSRVRRLSKEENHSASCKRLLLRHLDIDLVIDVGANRGQYGRHLRGLGYNGRIVSFEPGSEAHCYLIKTASADARWATRRLALGERCERRRFNIAGNIGLSSSLLPILLDAVAAAPNSAYVGVEEVEVATLDSLFAGLRGGGRHVYLKLDVQGSERSVLAGAATSLPMIDFLEIECSLSPLYEGEALLPETMDRLGTAGFALVGVSRGFSDMRTGRMLQVDAWFARPERFPRTTHNPA
jgi:FkbM family methyltransferase